MSKFEVYKDKKGETRFRYRASNGEIVFSSESYKAKASAMKAIESIKKNAAEAVVEDAPVPAKKAAAKPAAKVAAKPAAAKPAAKVAAKPAAAKPAAAKAPAKAAAAKPAAKVAAKPKAPAKAKAPAKK